MRIFIILMIGLLACGCATTNNIKINSANIDKKIMYDEASKNCYEYCSVTMCDNNCDSTKQNFCYGACIESALRSEEYLIYIYKNYNHKDWVKHHSHK